MAATATTVNPILQNGLVPVFTDIELGTYNATPERVEQAMGLRTKAIMMAHALGDPFQVREIAQLAEAGCSSSSRTTATPWAAPTGAAHRHLR
ncbi:hypothetical protein SALBM217S_05110 [Streptomyces griseoloalbus]